MWFGAHRHAGDGRAHPNHDSDNVVHECPCTQTLNDDHAGYDRTESEAV